ncbi:MAG: DUF2442 domain-containing protein [Bacteroidales bacterium]|jgi:hypothetical protein|nr:DUF2442 domain-containing protein [Bacteroidales bacterium]
MKTKTKYEPIVDAKYLHDYLIDVTFKDRTHRVIDLEKFVKTSKFPLVRKFAPLKLFKQFRVEHSSLAWGDNECDIDPFDVYAGKYDAMLEHA